MMFTEGLDSSSINWVREGAELKRPLHQARSLNMNRPIYKDRSGLPPPSFQSVRLRSGLMPNSRPINGDMEATRGYGHGNDSEYEETSDSGEEEQCGRYSGDSSPQENPLLNRSRGFGHDYRKATSIGPSSMPPVQRRETYTGDYLRSYDRQPPLNSQRQQHQEHFSRDPQEGRREFGYSGDQMYSSYSRQQTSNEYIEEDSSYSGESFEEDESRIPRDHGGNQRVDHAGATSSEDVSMSIGEDPISYASQSRFKGMQQRSSAQIPEKDIHNSGARPGNLSEIEMPSAPPMAGSASGPNIRAQEIFPNPAISRGVDKLNAQQPNDQSLRPGPGIVGEAAAYSCTQPTLASHPATFHLSTCWLLSIGYSGQGAWQSLIAYEACVRLCLQAWARGCMEAPGFLHDECLVLRNAFGLQQILLQPEEELLRKGSASAAPEGSAPKPKKSIGKIKVQVRKVRMMLDAPSGCSCRSFGSSIVNFESLRDRTSNIQSTLLAGWEAVRKVRVTPQVPLQATHSQRSIAYMQASARYVRHVSGLLRTGVTSLRNSSINESTQETYSCFLRLKSSIEGEAFRMQPGSGETHVFLPESQGDDLIVEVQDSKGNVQGRVLVQLASISDDLTEKTRWWSIYKEPEHEYVGKVQLFINYITSGDEMGATKCGPVAETVAYDLVLEVAMKVQHFQQRNLQLYGSWRWLLTEFASYYGVSDSYTKLRYLSSIMEVSTPTEDCLILIHALLVPVVNARDENTLSRQEKRILGDIEDQVNRLLAMVFENYKSLDDSIPSGLIDVFGPASGIAAPALVPAVKIYTLLHDILSPEAQLTLCSYFQTAARKRSKRHMAETDEFVVGNNEGILMDAVTVSTAYMKMKTLCINIRNEISTDIEIHNKHILPSSIDLPNIAAAIYNVDLCNRLRAFLVSCPPSGPSPPVAELVIATADFQRDIASWNICPVKGSVDAKELFHLYIVLWIQDRRLLLLDSCKLEKVRSTGVTTQHSTTPFVEDMYERIKETLNEYEVIVRRWPEYTFQLENAIADVEKAMVEALEKHYVDVLAPLKETMMPKKFGLQYVQKLTKRRSVCLYKVPNELGVLLNTIKRLLDVLRPKIELQLKSWVSCLPEGACGNMIFGEHMSEITVMLRAKFKNVLQAIIEKLADNTQVQRETKIKKIIQDTKDAGGESEIRDRMQALNTQLVDTISHLHDTFTSRVFVAICRGYWDRMGQDVLQFLENRKENRSLYKGSRITVGILDDTFASQMQRLQGHALQEKDLEPPRSIMEVRSMLCKDAPNGTDSSNYYYF